MKFLIIIVLFIQVLQNNHFHLFDSKIKLKVKGKGYNQILGYDKVDNEIYRFEEQYFPDKIIINDKKQISVKNSYLFNETNNIVELYWERSIDKCREMFRRCVNITEIDVSNFDTSEVIDMTSMFVYCSSLTSINLTNFDTSNVKDMGFMFDGCSSLTSLDLSSFDTSQVTRMKEMFYNCKNLEYINMINFSDINLKEFPDIFKDTPDNIVILINQENNGKIVPEIENKSCYNIENSNNLILKQKKIINDNNECIDDCENSEIYKYEYNGKCYDNCTNGFLYDYNNNLLNKCKCELDKCLICNKVSINFNLCIECNKDYFPKENDPSNIGEYIDCYKEPEGYYLDTNVNLYKNCYYTCKACKISGDNKNHNCLECNNNFSIKVNNNNYYNCYQECEYNYYFDIDGDYQCTLNQSCPDDYPTLIEDKKECIKYDINKIYEDIKKNEIQTLSKEEEIEYYDYILESIEAGFTSKNYDISDLDNGNDEMIDAGKIKITFTSVQNQDNNKFNNITSIHLGDCENSLRSHYNISDNETIYILKLDVEQDGMKIPKIEFKVYSKLNGSNLVELNISVCERNKILLSIPLKIDEDINKLNASSDYYKDKCYSASSDSGTDISIKDRQKEFIEKNRTACQEYCDFSYYDDKTQKANCSCIFKESYESYVNMNIDQDKLYENFGDENKKEISNIDITSCNVLGSKENIENNAGFFSLIIIYAILIIIFIIFCSKGYNLLENKMDEVIYKKFEKKKHKNKNTSKSKNKNKNKVKIKEALNKSNKKTKNTQKTNNTQKKRNNKNIIINKQNNKKHLTNPIKTSLIKDSYRNFIEINQQNMITKVYNNNVIMNNEKSNNFNLKPDTDYELNWLSYQEAILYDKRTSCDYYGSLIKSKQLFIFTFCSFNDYNSGIIKKFMFFLSFALHYTTNALFFDESNFHQIYKDEGKFNFSYQLPYIIYSAIISSFVLRLILQFLVLTDKDILEVKNQMTKELAINMKRQKLKYMKIKFAIFFILNFILLGLFWYYLTCFNAIYKNTQIYLIENTFISFGFSLFYPFIINIFPSIIRSCSINSLEKNNEYCYKISQIVQII